MTKQAKKPIRLDLNRIKRRQVYITLGVKFSMVEAASVCLDDQKHKPGVALLMEGLMATNCVLRWPAVNDKIIRSWKDEREATRWGAEAVACLIALEFSGLQVIERSISGDGFDYWLGVKVNGDFQRMIRLEVSGLRNGTMAQIDAREVVKINQTKQSDDTEKPAWIAIIEFSRPFARITER